MNNSISPLDEGVDNPSPVLVSTSHDPIGRKHKKQETTHFKKYKEETKSTKKEEKKERDIMKVKIATLADKLYRRNKITKSLYNKMYNMSIGAARLPTLMTAYKSLKDFKHSETTVKKSNFNQAIKQKKGNKKAYNTIYIKYMVHEQHTEKEITISIGNHTFTMTGDEDDIRREIKKFIAYELSMPYNIRLKLSDYLLIKKTRTVIFTDGKEAKKHELVLNS